MQEYEVYIKTRRPDCRYECATCPNVDALIAVAKARLASQNFSYAEIDIYCVPVHEGRPEVVMTRNTVFFTNDIQQETSRQKTTCPAAARSQPTT